MLGDELGMSHVIESNLQRFPRCRWALTTVVTVLIILVIAVLLAAAVSYFAINVTSTRVQEESLLFPMRHIWYDQSNSVSEAAILITNTGGRDIIVQKVTLRGQTVNWSTTYYYKGTFTITELPFIENLAEDSLSPISDGYGSYEHLVAATGDMPLSTGESMVVYVKNADSITVGDVGLTVAINVYTMQAIYYKESNVEVPILPPHS